MRCNNCGCTFDPMDVVYIREDHGEVHQACPVCHYSGLSETTACDICGKEFTDEELKCGFCAECLYDALSGYHVIFDYLADSGLLTDFMLTKIYGCEGIYQSSDSFDELMQNEYWHNVCLEESKKEGSFKAIRTKARNYILPHYPDLGSEEFEFADWYANYRRLH